jgi:UDP-glucuronate 4-epimerase
MKVLVTGAAGFIGMHVADRLLADGCEVVGVDSLDDYYDPALKAARLARLRPMPGFSFVHLDVADRAATAALFETGGFDRVVHLAAQAGVRHSLKNPHAYAHSNLVGFVNMLEGCRHAAVGHLVYASSSSVYGGNAKMPFSEGDPVDHPVSLYAATKKANELMAHSYSHLYGLPTTGLRFFTVYGPWGRPDMAAFLFVDAILSGRPIDVYNHGDMQRDFTYVDDIVEGVRRVLDCVPAPYRILNIGNADPVPLMDFIAAIEDALGTVATKRLMPMQPGDVPATFADVSALTALIGSRPRIDVREGVRRFVEWYRAYYAR